MRHRAATSLAKWLLVAAAVALPACDDDKIASGPGKDAGVLPDSGKPVDGGKPDTGIPTDSGSDTGIPDAALKPCVEKQSDLPRPPSGSLPCDMLPPDFSR